jgi:hypothetical protein
MAGSWRSAPGARGRGSGVELDFQQAARLEHFRDGKLIWLKTFTNMEQALETAGLG